jgi:hypothetical protein
MKPVLAKRHGGNVTSYDDDQYEADGRCNFVLAA